MSNITLIVADGRSVDADIEDGGRFSLNMHDLVSHATIGMSRDQLITFHHQVGLLLDTTEPAPVAAPIVEEGVT